MPLPRFQFTIGRLIQLVAVLAVGLALFRTPLGPVILGIGFILSGFAADRARGGSGLLGGIAASNLGYLGLAGYHCWTQQFLFDFPSALTPGVVPFVMALYLIAGTVVGLIICVPVWMVVSVHASWSGDLAEDNISRDRGNVDRSEIDRSESGGMPR